MQVLRQLLGQTGFGYTFRMHGYMMLHATAGFCQSFFAAALSPKDSPSMTQAK